MKTLDDEILYIAPVYYEIAPSSGIPSSGRYNFRHVIGWNLLSHQLDKHGADF